MGVSLVALFVALSGGAYAATAIPNDSVGTAQLKAASVGNAQLKATSVGNAQLRPGSVGTAQLKSQAVINTKIALGAVGFARINQSQVQRRVTGTCKTGQAIIEVAQNGTVTCATTGTAEYNSTASSVSLTPRGDRRERGRDHGRQLPAARRLVLLRAGRSEADRHAGHRRYCLARHRVLHADRQLRWSFDQRQRVGDV